MKSPVKVNTILKAFWVDVGVVGVVSILSDSVLVSVYLVGITLLISFIK